MRLDKFLWSVRLFSTRKKAHDACVESRIKLNQDLAKASKTVKAKDLVSIKELGFWRVFLIVNIPKSRVGAKLVDQLIQEVTNEETLQTLQTIHESNRKNKLAGIKGRPSKKVRRDLEKWTNSTQQ